MANQYGPGPAGANVALNVSVATVLKTVPGMVHAISVTVAGSAVGGVYDAGTTGGNVAANLIGVIPGAVTTQPLVFEWRCFTGILIVPPTGGAVSVSFV